ncbi:MAG TPA: hypothetical protein VNV86_20515 [Candidatus Acidoferrum sp.]|nr:hypothetical protein [Candidatus Acidoferrum sp.]
MPGRTPREAVENYARPIRETLACVTDAIVGYNGGVYPSDSKHTLCFVNSPVGRLFGTELSLFFSQNYSLQQASGGDQEWKVRTEGYIYRLDDENGSEIISFHWHPYRDLVKYPHLHLKRKGSGITRSELEQAHIPTGRLSIEAIVLFLEREFSVKPRGADWRERVEQNLEIFERNRSWA